MRPRTSVGVAALLAAILLSPLHAESDVGFARDRAKSLQRAGKHVEAFRLLETAASRYPEASGLRRDLEKARGFAADSIAGALQGPQARNLPQELGLLATLRDIAPADPRLPVLVANAESNLKDFQSQVERAIAMAGGGDASLATRIAPTLESVAKILPASRDDLRRLRLALKLTEARGALAADDALATVQALKGAEALGAPRETTDEMYRQLEQSELRSTYQSSKAGLSPRAYADTAYRLGILANNCEVCAESSKALGEVRSDFARRLNAAAASYSAPGTAPYRAAECGIVATLGDRAPLLVNPGGLACERSTRSAGAATGVLDFRFGEACRAPEGIQQEMAAAAEAEAVRLGLGALGSEGRPGLAPSGKLTVVVEDCPVSRAVRNRQEIGSSYRAASTQVSNPEYSAAVSEFAAAKRAAEETNRLAAAYPDGRYLASQIGATARLVAARKRVDRTPAMIEQTIEATYTFDAFDEEVEARIAGEIRVEYGAGRWRSLSPIAARLTKSGRVVQGVHPADTQGARNQTPNFPEDALLLGSLWEENLEKVKASVVEAVAAHVVLDAAVAMERSDSVAAASRLLAFSTAEGSLIDPRLARLRERVLNSALLPAAELAAENRTELLEFSRSHPETAGQLAAEAPRSDRRFVADQVLDSVVFIMTETAKGSGFFVRSDGLVLTNYHVIEGASLILLKTRSGEAATARVVQYNKALDVAVLKAEGVTAKAVALAAARQVSIGQPVFALGAPLGLEFSATSGIVSAIRLLDGYRWIQHDAPINPGNSGGPLIGEDGRVIGVNTWKVAEKGIEGLQFAVSIDAVRQVLSF